MATKRMYRPAETRLIEEWAFLKHPKALQLSRVRLGKIVPTSASGGHTDAELMMLGSWRSWVDKILVYPDELIVVEAKIRPDLGCVAELELYMDLLPATPELAAYLNRPRRGLVLLAIEDARIRLLAARRGFTVEYYHPDWIDAYVDSLYKRHASPSHQAE